jgi:hypothetical protein
VSVSSGDTHWWTQQYEASVLNGGICTDILEVFAYIDANELLYTASNTFFQETGIKTGTVTWTQVTAAALTPQVIIVVSFFPHTRLKLTMETLNLWEFQVQRIGSVNGEYLRTIEGKY